ncbi:hypothetical protein [Shewanella sp.]|uniref:hypothetical protein n=1 Tax=Shewanella sp. TaxID=50422 RepID=UPI001B63584C|nr:hypothetical protein [Shewanella sp.]MBP6517905.1 hypothetical protein [Shewanella sp.]
MSTIANWSYTQTLTLWRRGAKDQFGRYTYSAPEHLLCSYRIGGSEQYTDSTGVAFTPKSIFWTELKITDNVTFVAKPNFGDKILLGEFAGSPEPTASDIRMITIDDASMFGASEKPDYILGI